MHSVSKVVRKVVKSLFTTYAINRLKNRPKNMVLLNTTLTVFCGRIRSRNGKRKRSADKQSQLISWLSQNVPEPIQNKGAAPYPIPNTKGFFNGLTGQKNPENDTEMIQNYRRYRHTSGNGRKERTHAKNEQETAAGMVFFPAASESREFHLRSYHIQWPLPGLYP